MRKPKTPTGPPHKHRTPWHLMTWRLMTWHLMTRGRENFDMAIEFVGVVFTYLVVPLYLYHTCACIEPALFCHSTGRRPC